MLVGSFFSARTLTAPPTNAQTKYGSREGRKVGRTEGFMQKCWNLFPTRQSYKNTLCVCGKRKTNAHTDTHIASFPPEKTKTRWTHCTFLALLSILERAIYAYEILILPYFVFFARRSFSLFCPTLPRNRCTV